VGGNDGKGIVENGQLLQGIDIKKLVNLSDPSSTVAGFVLVSEFAQKNDLTQTVSGNASRVTLKARRGLGLNADPNAYSATFGNIASLADAPQGILICIQEEGNGRRASLTIGGDGKSLAIERTIDSWPTALDRCGP
jgi:hypothetical protein